MATTRQQRGDHVAENDHPTPAMGRPDQLDLLTGNCSSIIRHQRAGFQRNHIFPTSSNKFFLFRFWLPQAEEREIDDQSPNSEMTPDSDTALRQQKTSSKAFRAPTLERAGIRT